jgi:adenosylcobinamide kinase/adenosylcobinamide-phosphate guanylyltransferase
LTNHLLVDEARGDAAAKAELARLLAHPDRLILVSNEVGMGLVPPYPLGRRFQDALGRLNQFPAAAADQVYICWAGIPVEIKAQDARRSGLTISGLASAGRRASFRLSAW